LYYNIIDRKGINMINITQIINADTWFLIEFASFRSSN